MARAYRTNVERLSLPLPLSPVEAQTQFIREKAAPKRAAANAALLLSRLARERPDPRPAQIDVAVEAWETIARQSQPGLAGAHTIAPLLKDPLLPYLEALIKAGLTGAHFEGDKQGPLVFAFNNEAIEVFERLYQAGVRTTSYCMDRFCETSLHRMDEAWLQMLARCDYKFRAKGYVPQKDKENTAEERKRAALYTRTALYQVNYKAGYKPRGATYGL